MSTKESNPDDALVEDAAKRFKEQTGVDIGGPYTRMIKTFLKNGQTKESYVQRIQKGLFDGEENKKEALTRWIEELVKTKTIPPIPLVLLKPSTFTMSATDFVPKGPAAKSADFSAGSTGLFGATSSPFSEDKVLMCEKGLCCTDILCTKRHPRTRYTEVTLPQV